MARKVLVASLLVTYDEVEIPLECPVCKTDLTAKNALKEWDYQDECSLQTMDKDGEFSDDYNWEGGENFLPVSFRCVSCDHELASGTETLLEQAQFNDGIASILLKRLRKAKDIVLGVTTATIVCSKCQKDCDVAHVDLEDGGLMCPDCRKKDTLGAVSMEEFEETLRQGALPSSDPNKRD